MPVNRAPTIHDLISQAQGKMQNTSSLLRYVLLAESLKIWVPCDDSSSDDSSSDDSSTDDGAGSAPAVSRAEVEVGNAEASTGSDTVCRVLPSVSDDDAGPRCKRRRLDNFPGEWRGDTDELNTLEPRPGPSDFQDNSSEEDDGDVWPVRGAPLAIWLDVDW
ncbi:hypothetical protein MRX96_052181 [Rhipicephalus microplus]